MVEIRSVFEVDYLVETEDETTPGIISRQSVQINYTAYIVADNIEQAYEYAQTRLGKFIEGKAFVALRGVRNLLSAIVLPSSRK